MRLDAGRGDGCTFVLNRIRKRKFRFNTPEGQVQNLLGRVGGATEAEKYDQYRGGVGHTNVTSVLDMRRVEVGLRFKF